MNDTTQPPMPSLCELARQDIKRRMEEALLILHEHQAEAERFEALCEALRGHGLEFESSIYCTHNGMQYWIRLHTPEEVALTGEMMLALCATGYENAEAESSLITPYEIHRLSSDAVSIVNLAVNREAKKPVAEAVNDAHIANRFLTTV
jgi:hypothetical protein